MTLRGTDWPVVLGGSGLGGAILTACVVVGDEAPPLAHVRLALVPLAAAAAFVWDEPAAAAVDAVPRARPGRSATRALGLLIPLTVWITALLALDLRTQTTPVVVLLVEGAGVMAAAAAGAAVLRRLGRDEPGEVVATVVAAAVLAGLVFTPSVRAVPVFPASQEPGPSSLAWVTLAFVAVIVAVAASREQYRLRR